MTDPRTTGSRLTVTSKQTAKLGKRGAARAVGRQRNWNGDRLVFSVLAPVVFAQSSVPLTHRLEIFDELLAFVVQFLPWMILTRKSFQFTSSALTS